MPTNESHGTYQDIATATPDSLRPILEALRNTVLEQHKDRVEIAWPRQNIVSFGVGPKKMTEHYVYIAPQKSHVNLGFYRGAMLADPDGLLEGTGKMLRHVKIRTLSEAAEPGIAVLIDSAIDDIRESLTEN